MGPLIRVVIVDDHPVVGGGLASAFAADPTLGIRVVGVALTADEAVDAVSATRPDVVLCDLMLDGHPAGLDLIHRILADAHPPQVLVLSSYDAPGLVNDALAAGAAGYLVKTAGLHEIAGAISAASMGASVTPEWLVDKARAAPRGPSTRELAVIHAAARGRSNGEIASTLGLSIKTVEGYLHQMYVRYDVASRTELVSLASSQGWLHPDAPPSDPTRPSPRARLA